MTFLRIKPRTLKSGRRRWYLVEVETPSKRERLVKGARFDTKREAEDALRKAKKARALVSAGAGLDLTVAEVLEVYRRHLEEQGKPHWRNVEAAARLHIGPALGDRRLARLTAGEVEAYLEDRLAAGASSQTVAHERGALRAAVNHAARRDLYHGRNAAEDAKLPERVSHAQREILEPHEVEAILPHLEPERRALVGFVKETGCRPGEALGLTRAAVDFRRRFVTFRASHGRDRTKDLDPRRVPLSDRALEHVEAALALEAELAKGERDESGRWKRKPRPVSRYVFPAEDGTRQRSDTKLARMLRAGMARAAAAGDAPELVDGWRLICRRRSCSYRAEHGRALVIERLAGEELEERCPACGMILWRSPEVRRVTFYSLRHTAISRWYRAGVPTDVIEELVGHYDWSVAKRHYLHLEPEDLREMLNRAAPVRRTRGLASVSHLKKRGR